MGPVFKYAKEQYELIRESRIVLFDYCKTISPTDFLNENSSFGRGGSIRNLLVHIANTYEFWIAKYGLTKDIVFTTYDSRQNINDVIDLFNVVDSIMYEFIELFKEPETKEISYEINGTKSSTSPFKLLTHVMTHEFHHKGQILSLSRHLGYTPVDTDVMR
jgi:uncharacterized damage-inducible protein DinB